VKQSQIDAFVALREYLLCIPGVTNVAHIFHREDGALAVYTTKKSELYPGYSLVNGCTFSSDFFDISFAPIEEIADAIVADWHKAEERAEPPPGWGEEICT